ncbi:MAG: Asp-tRNA(Asn)/Glu-tRNA(Gln) amidotransferase subunit GatC [Actinobacteria bacterium]|nr:Asp-tRNA(Asn)/Glu-tRNA(Gln) amidotransferase subunit GatC [Actinomycetota bacterium]
MKIISLEQASHVAKLAELELSSDELDKITSQLDDILGHVAKINEADTEGVRPTSHTLDTNNVLREDTVKDSLSQEDALKNAPQQSGGGFLVPKID